MPSDICRIHFHIWSNAGDRNEAVDHWFSLKQWFAAGAHSYRLRKTGSAHCYFRISLSYSIGEGNILRTILLPFLSVFNFSMPSKVIIIVIEFMFLGINIFSTLPRVHFNPRLTARAKISLSRAQNIFIAANINSIVLMDLGFRLMCISCLTE